MTTVAWMLLVLVVVVELIIDGQEKLVVMAVDRSKFRTCDQTSFCRRHRGQHSSRLYEYRLEKDSIHFHVFSKQEEEQHEHEHHDDDGGLWKSLQKRFLGQEDMSNKDPYVRGPPPTLTGILHNTAKETSSGSSSKEELVWTVHCIKGGMIRMRIHELYGKHHHIHSSPFEQARVTYDELVLKSEQLHSAPHAQWIRPSSSSSDNDNDNNNNNNDDNNDALLSKLIPLVVSFNNKNEINNNKDNYMALQYGDDDSTNNNNTMILLIRLESFAVYLFRQDNLDAGPIVTLGAHDMMHFEIRRKKPQDLQSQDEKQKQQEEKEASEEKTDNNQNKKQEEKEIVGYWEDGLAIYADGTREEKHSEQQEEDHHRKLSESELDREGLWEETFSTHVDSKPHGPMSVGMDITFPNSQHLFGLPEHASSTQLQMTFGGDSSETETHYQEPYRLYNLDVFEYELDETMALYGHVPLIVSHSIQTGTAGVFWFNPTETFVDVMTSDNDNDSKSTNTHWMSESGILDIFLLPGPSPEEMYEQYGQLTGTMPLPPMFSLGYHQCRWNYKDEDDVYQVHDKFEELDYPYDVLWLDIEHTNGKRYFTWDDNLFPTPKSMQDKLNAQGRNMVTIIDPHIKRDDNYYIHKEATSKGLYIKNKDATQDYDGWCWPGSSSYLDFTDANVRSWWADQFAYDKYQGSTPSLYTWNDMNEPSVFNGPEVSMQKDLLNLNGQEHREWHNLYGMLFQRATSEGLVRRNQPDENVRPFVLSRAFFAGSQQYGAIWTGDNLAEWSHLEIASPMLLSLNVAALSFVGADVGGFFGNPDAELMTRWMQAGAYQPFFRGHAHHDAKRREPWMFGDETMVRLRRAAMARYALLPFWYTVFREASMTGMPVMRMMWMQYPQTTSLFATDDQYMIGSDLLVKPVTASGVTQTTVSFPTADIWYDVDTMKQIPATGANDGAAAITVKSDIDKIPVYQRGGSVIARKLRLRRSSRLMKGDPYTLYIALDKSKAASGTLYMDDEETFNHERKGDYGEAHFTVDLSDGGSAKKVLTNTVTLGSGWAAADEIDELKRERMIERIVVMGVQSPPKEITVAGGDAEKLSFEFDGKTKVLVIRKPNLSALGDWEMQFSG